MGNYEVNDNKFKDYLKEGQPIGDAVDMPFVNGAVTDLNLPDPNSWEELKDYIKGCNPDAPPNVITAAQYIWDLYISHTHGQVG